MPKRNHRLNTLKWLAFFSCILVTFTSNAEVYKCVEKGVTVFSSLPCKNETNENSIAIGWTESKVAFWKKQEEKHQYNLKVRQQRAERYVENSPGLKNEIKQAILDCRVIQGMSRTQLQVSWGSEPLKEKRKVTKDSSLTFLTYKEPPICMEKKFTEATLTFNNRTQLLVGWNIRY